jgi:hypothetical protein
VTGRVVFAGVGFEFMFFIPSLAPHLLDPGYHYGPFSRFLFFFDVWSSGRCSCLASDFLDGFLSWDSSGNASFRSPGSVLANHDCSLLISGTTFDFRAQPHMSVHSRGRQGCRFSWNLANSQLS